MATVVNLVMPKSRNFPFALVPGFFKRIYSEFFAHVINKRPFNYYVGFLNHLRYLHTYVSKDFRAFRVAPQKLESLYIKGHFQDIQQEEVTIF